MSATIIDRELEAKHRAVWALGDYRAVADDLVLPLGSELVAAAGIQSGDRVLDVAAGTGSAAFAAAALGARVIASDLCPELLEHGRAAAAARGADVEFREANAEALPFADGEFDAVISSIGVMFAPHHQRAADELIRVCRPGGTVAVLSWTPSGFIGQMFATMKPYLPAPPPGVQPAPLWGDEAHVRTLFGDRVDGIGRRRGALAVGRFSDGAAFRDYFKANYGPIVSAYQSIDDENAAALDAELAALGDRALADSPTMQWEYLVLTARRR
ncbi:class I SAM-dependent methyltransferase [Candidatus Mycolicibacterium alkanivorans]|uniref:Methyltransferase domain-containing protein n=1 Tax=Candidatus Mycolicibacterium alkanivorans TaxID=2954114 RepID=A0ABS9YZI9_9MYCO|nr:methyltransferase domain-containing protein [Candidatus Mycolicibacterium alkanivorans]MCI4676686.1 methyltransferase domain-containing protein [Candidatus Mycolicibacterium alkanivorans]